LIGALRYSGTITVVSLRLLYLIFRQAASGALHGSIKQVR
jgi:hypothetical protein